MNREIKFRAWDEKNKIMHNNFQFIKSGNEGNDWIVFLSDKQPDFETAMKNPYFSQQLKIMQYTGIKDKNGTEIYEGDIIVVRSLHDSNIFDEVWDNEKQLAIPQIVRVSATPPHSFVMPSDSSWNPGYWEVIGNKFDNPELMEGK